MQSVGLKVPIQPTPGAIRRAANTKPKQRKSRTGCITCKAKRLKCDENKPACEQCTRKGLVCEGYQRDYKWRSYEEQKKNIRFDVRNSQFALQQAQARVDAAQKARDLAQRTFDITKQEQQLGAKSSYDTLVQQNALAVAESTLVAAQTAFEKAKVDIDRATGTTLERMGVSIDDARSGVVTHGP